MQPTYTRYLYKPLANCDGPGVHADVYLPRPNDQSAPIAMVIHGGGFMCNNSESIRMNQVTYLLDAGYVVVSIDYRLGPLVDFIEMSEDVKDAWVWSANVLPGLIQDSATLDVNRMVVLGYSAGATLAMFLGFGAPIKPLAILSFYGAFAADSLETHKPTTKPLSFLPHPSLPVPPPGFLEQVHSFPILTHHIQNDDILQDPQRYFFLQCLLEGSVHNHLGGLDKFRQISATHHITSEFPPTYLIHGLADDVVHADASVAVQKRLEASGVEHKLRLLPGLPHSFDKEVKVGEELWEEIKEGLDWLIIHSTPK